MASVGACAKVAVTFAGKLKTTLQMFGIAFMVYERNIMGIEIYELGYILLIAAAGMTMWSMVVYLRAAWPSMVSNG
jgi:phosphatidylglycerophosphate synthase